MATTMCRKTRKRDLLFVDPILLISFRGARAQHKTVRVLKRDCEVIMDYVCRHSFSEISGQFK